MADTLTEARTETQPTTSLVGVNSVTDPGIYNIDSDTYHNDPCPTPSLSAGMINDLIVAPAKCRENSRRLNPNYEEPEGQEKFTIGTVSHIMFLEPNTFDEKVLVCHFDDWRSRPAKQARAAARESGVTPILTKHMGKIRAARKAFFANSFTTNAFADGQFEQSMFWRHPIYGFWCRCRPDFISSSRRHINDYKATADANPEKFGKHAHDMGYHRRAAWYLEGCETLFGRMPDHYWFCNQEIKPPFLTSIVELDYQALEAGKMENNRAAGIFNACLKSGDWYGYRHPSDLTRDLAFQVGLPNWAYTQIDSRNS